MKIELREGVELTADDRAAINTLGADRVVVTTDDRVPGCVIVLWPQGRYTCAGWLDEQSQFQQGFPLNPDDPLAAEFEVLDSAAV